MEPLLLTVRQAAALLGYRLSAMHEKVASGAVPYVQIPPGKGRKRISAEWLKEEIARQTERNTKWRTR